MLLTVLKSKIHKAIVTDINLEYEGSCGISEELMEAANIREYEQIHIYNLNNGERFTTYAIPVEKRGVISVRGSAARKAMPGDLLIICTYCQISAGNECDPIKVHVTEKNWIKPSFFDS